MRRITLLTILLTCAPLAGQGDVDQAIVRGVDWLLAAQEVDGSWRGPDYEHYTTGMTALGIYTLVKCGLSPDHRAIRKALSFIRQWPGERTYDAGVNLMAYAALGGKIHPQRIKQLTLFLLDERIRDRWSYPRTSGDAADLSNTQYGVLGLRAAAACGQKIPSEVWKDVAEGLMDSQASYGGWGYRKRETRVTASMTVAGLGCLLVCSRQLSHHKHTKSLRRKIRVYINRGFDWLQRNWSVERNLAFPKPKNGVGLARWFYYYLYGLERAGTFSGRSTIGHRNWYLDGSKVLVKRQAAKGSWGSPYGERDANTCFALLFLRRGSRKTGLPPRVRLKIKQDAASAFLVGMDGKNPLLAWVRTLNGPVRKRLALHERIASVEWRIDAERVSEVAAPPGDESLSFDYLLKQPLRKNGKHEIQAFMHFTAADGKPGGQEVSNKLLLKIDNIEEPPDVECIADAGHNLLRGHEISADASSIYDKGRGPQRVADGRYCTQWLCGRDDRAPWVKITLERGVRASVLKFAAAHPYGDKDTNFGRPRDVLIILNGSKKLPLRLKDTVRAKQRLEFSARRIFSIQIRIKSLYPGTRKGEEKLVGIKEMELFR